MCEPEFNLVVYQTQSLSNDCVSLLFLEHKETSSTCNVIYEVESAGNHYSGYHLLSCDQGQSAEYTITASHHSSTDPRYVDVFFYRQSCEKKCSVLCSLPSS